MQPSRQLGLPVNKLSRKSSTYSVWRRWLTLIDSITAFTETPLIGIFYLGLLISALSALIGIGLLIRKILFGHILEGWVSVMISVWFLGGILIFCVGVIGIYISKIFIETKQRPYTIIRRVHEQHAGMPSDRVLSKSASLPRGAGERVRAESAIEISGVPNEHIGD